MTNDQLKAVYFLLHFPGPCRPPKRSAWTVGVTHHRVLWSPDFPLPAAASLTRAHPRAATVRPTRRCFYYSRCRTDRFPVVTGHAKDPACPVSLGQKDAGLLSERG